MRNVVNGMKGYYERGMEFLFRLIDECPDDLWTKKGGGFFYWQQVYHAFYIVDFFLLPPDGRCRIRPMEGPWPCSAKFLRRHLRRKQ